MSESSTPTKSIVIDALVDLHNAPADLFHLTTAPVDQANLDTVLVDPLKPPMDPFEPIREDLEEDMPYLASLMRQVRQ